MFTRLVSFFPFLVLGAIHALSFAPDPLPTSLLPFIQLIVFSAFIYLLFKAENTKKALWGAWYFGLAQFSVGVYWLYISMHYYGALAAPLAVIALVSFAALMALYFVIAVAIARYFIPQARDLSGWRQLQAACICASAWTLLEWVRGTFLTGFPWLNVAYAHVDSMFTGWAPIVGAYGVTWFATFTAAVLAFFTLNTTPKAPKTHNIPLGIAIVFSIMGFSLGGITWYQPAGEPFFVRIAQGNVDQKMKFDPQYLQDGVSLYQTLAALEPKTPESAPQLIVLPETIIPLFQHQWEAEFWQQWIDIAQAQNATLLLGAPLYSQADNQPSYTNSAITIQGTDTPEAIRRLDLQNRYDKHHLVPFGEFIPTGFRWFVERLSIPLGDFNRGSTRQSNFAFHGQWIGPDICYEDVFGEEIIRSLRDSEEMGPGATLLINLSNLAWFGDTWALRQHLQISRFRSIETARPIIRSTNTGVSAAILPNGTLQAALPTHVVGVLDIEVQGATGLTPYVLYGNWPLISISLLLLIVLGFSSRSRSHSSKSSSETGRL